MGASVTTPRPSILALQPARLAATLRPLGIAPRELALQAPRPTPLPYGWGVVPPATTPLLLDLVGMELPLVAMLLSDLHQQQREQRTVPLLVIPPTAVGKRRLVAISAISSVVIGADASPTTLARWVRAPLQLRSGQVWVKANPLALPLLDPRLVPLLAALSRATSVAQAAKWCYLARRTAYTILSDTCEQLGIHTGQHHHPARWAAILTAALETLFLEAQSTSVLRK